LTTALTPQPDIVSCACHSRLTPQFGVKLPNAQLLADEYAEQGKFYVIAPDLANDDWIDHGLLKVSGYSLLLSLTPLHSIAPRKSDPEPGMVEKAAGTAKVGAALGPWLVRHREGVTKPLVEKVLEHVRADSATGKVRSTAGPPF